VANLRRQNIRIMEMRESIGGRIDGPAYREWLPRSRVLKGVGTYAISESRWRTFFGSFFELKGSIHRKKRNVPIESIGSPLKASVVIFLRARHSPTLFEIFDLF